MNATTDEQRISAGTKVFQVIQKTLTETAGTYCLDMEKSRMNPSERYWVLVLLSFTDEGRIVWLWDTTNNSYTESLRTNDAITKILKEKNSEIFVIEIYSEVSTKCRLMYMNTTKTAQLEAIYKPEKSIDSITLSRDKESLLVILKDDRKRNFLRLYSLLLLEEEMNWVTIACVLYYDYSKISKCADFQWYSVNSQVFALIVESEAEKCKFELVYPKYLNPNCGEAKAHMIISETKSNLVLLTYDVQKKEVSLKIIDLPSIKNECIISDIRTYYGDEVYSNIVSQHMFRL